MKEFVINGKSIRRGAVAYIKKDPLRFIGVLAGAISVAAGVVKDILVESEVKNGPIEVDGKVE